MSRTIEGKIRRNAVFLYITVAVICGIMLAYLYRTSMNLNGQRAHIERYHEILLLTNDLVFHINQAQADANLYVTSGNRVYYTRYVRTIGQVKVLSDSLSVMRDDSVRQPVLDDIHKLLRDKGNIIIGLSNRMGDYNPLDSLSIILQTTEPVIITDSVFVTTVVSDSVFTITQPKKFWRRVGDVFSPDRTVDTVVTVTTFQSDTVKTIQSDSLRIAPEVAEFAEEARQTYDMRLTTFSRELRRLLDTDREITVQLTALVDELHRDVILSTMREIENSEEIIRENYVYSLLALVLALLLILLMIILIIRDVNKGYRARKELEAANETIKNVMESRHRLLLSVSHDIKTPLGSILGYLDLWSAGGSPDPGSINDIRNAGAHIRSLVDTLLEYSALEQGKLTVNRAPFEPALMCEELSGMFRPLAAAKGITFNAECIESGRAVVSDELKIRQVLVNLLSNAVKYTSEGTVSLRIRREGYALVFQVSDTGKGMTAEECDRIFEPFSRAESNSAMAEGHGFGMYVVRGLVDLLKGEISISSEQGKGTTITLSVPVESVNSGIKEGPQKILVIDDDPVMTRMLAGMLEKLGHRPTECNDPAKAFGMLETDCDLIITDLEMGKLSGWDVLKKARSTRRGLKVMVMTGRAGFRYADARRNGFDGFLPKPFGMRQVALWVGNHAAQPLDLSGLEDMFGGDPEAVREILEAFAASLRDDRKKLAALLEDGDFSRSAELCHKMLPMFRQLKADTAVPLLEKMDRAKDMHDEGYEGWQKDVQKLLPLIDAILAGMDDGDSDGSSS